MLSFKLKKDPIQLGLILENMPLYGCLLMSTGEIAHYEKDKNKLYSLNEIVVFRLDKYEENNKSQVTILAQMKDIQSIELSKQYSPYEINRYDEYLLDEDKKTLMQFQYALIQNDFLYYDLDYPSKYLGDFKQLNFEEKLLIRAKFITPTFDEFNQKLNEIIINVKNTDIDKIIHSFKINVFEVFHCRPGKDDYYYLLKEYSLAEKHDAYWNKLFPEKTETLYEDRGYTDAYHMSIAKKEELGRQFKEEELYKKRAFKQYNQDEHIIFLLYEYIKDLFGHKECLITRESYWPIRSHLTAYSSSPYQVTLDCLFKERKL